jgi:hypothetical protein
MNALTNTQTGGGNAPRVITVEIWNSWNEHSARAGACQLLPDSKLNCHWAVYTVRAIGHYSSGSMPDYFSILERGGATGAHCAGNVRNLCIDGQPVDLPAMGREVSVFA